ncbi:sensor histidine kinase [Pseudonocardia sp. HH130630-07]|uniref:sensor histidine kinase n=1 Tax=Pseudonocardia sp. HH130630-07 TaxID=1690815 RepID=UPI0008151C0C|nr:histidine kinase [Pseudonocardia sp. HH130630-07]ANY05055.1 hypothetical protein AFB00_00480 [Pseudonocardia sp. HH130630-07]
MTGRLRWTTEPATYRRVLHVLLGTVVALPYLAAGWLLARTAVQGIGTGAVLLLAGAAVVVGIAVTVLPGVRELLVAAARTLLDADLPDPPGPGDLLDHRVPFADRCRAAVWLGLCAATGVVAGAAVLYLLPVAASMLIAPWQSLPPLPTGPGAWWTPPVGLLLVPLLAGGLAAAGAGQARLAPRLLGPGPRQRQAIALAARLEHARRRADRQAERARLARELHDSVGHALTVTTLQAGAAAELLHSDPEFARRALAAIADTGRAALDDLDHVLGLLNDDEDRADGPDDTGGGGGPGPVRDLEHLGGLFDGARAAGLDLHAETDPAPGLPAVVSREAYRLVQESLTNALRHAGPGPVTLRLRRTPDGLDLTVVNTVARRGRVRHGRGLTGARERVSLLGGSYTAGPDGDGRWVVRATVPGGPRTGPGPAGTERERGGAHA